jgi:hypothetical protein
MLPGNCSGISNPALLQVAADKHIWELAISVCDIVLIVTAIQMVIRDGQ